MTTPQLPPNIATEISRLKARVTALEAVAPQRPQLPPEDGIFSYSGTPTAGSTSMPWTPKISGTVYEAVVLADQPSTDVPNLIAVVVNRLTMASLTLPPNSTSNIVTLGVKLSRNTDLVQVALAQVGAGLVGLTIILRVRPLGLISTP